MTAQEARKEMLLIICRNLYIRNMINSNLYIPEINSLYSKEVNSIIDRYCHIIKRGFYTGEELSNIIKKYYPENIEDINFIKEHIRYLDKSLLTYYWCVKI